MLDSYDEYAPISPFSGGAFLMSGFAAEEQVSQAFEWQARGALLCVNIPEAGAYLLTYTENHRNHSGIGLLTGTAETEAAPASYIAFQAYAPARIFIGLAADAHLESLQLQRGTIADDAVGLYDDGPVIRFATPSIPTIFWSDVFFLDPTMPPIFMKQRESVCVQDSVRSPY